MSAEATPASLDVIGHAVIGHARTRALLRTLTAHTLLFAGPDGVGRRQVARWYAALRNCAADGEAAPCGRCESCLAWRHGEHPDYREIAPAATTSSGKVNRRPEIRIGQLVPRAGDDAEPLLRWLEQRPRYRRRVAVIDDAHLLNVSAANAFLKTLEEPPSQAIIILIAPSPQALLPTVASRSTVIRFATVPADELTRELERRLAATPETTPELASLLSRHPARQLGRVGPLLQAAADVDDTAAAMSAIEAFLAALPGSLEQAFEAADSLEKAWLNAAPGQDVPLLLQASLRRLPAGAYAAATGALERCEHALARYASPGPTLLEFTLALRTILRAWRVREVPPD